MKIPALRSLGELADAEPVIVVDTREQLPLPFSRLKTRAGALVTGDYSVAGLESLFAVERKSISDLVGCCVGQNRERLSASFTASAALGSSGFSSLARKL